MRAGRGPADCSEGGQPADWRGPAIGDSAVFLFVGLVLFLLAGISERRRRSLGEAASPFQARAPLVIGLCGLIDVVLAILLRLA